jgi:hypothetical protein
MPAKHARSNEPTKDPTLLARSGPVQSCKARATTWKRRISRVHSPPAEIDHDLEIPVEGEPQPTSLLKLVDDYARLFELACEECLSFMDRDACGQ